MAFTLEVGSAMEVSEAQLEFRMKVARTAFWGLVSLAMGSWVIVRADWPIGRLAISVALILVIVVAFAVGLRQRPKPALSRPATWIAAATAGLLATRVGHLPPTLYTLGLLIVTTACAQVAGVCLREAREAQHDA